MPTNNSSANATTSNSGSTGFKMIDNYIYFYHTNTLIALPTFPETINDTLAVSYDSFTPLTRTAPIYSYISSGPRSMQIDLKLHRDLMGQIYYQSSSLNIVEGENSLTYLNDDYVDTIVKEIQAAALPRYGSAEKMVDPPIVAIRFGDDIFCKGIIKGSVSVIYDGPILKTNKYAGVALGFSIEEIDPYDAESIMLYGGFRGFSKNLERRIYKQ